MDRTLTSILFTCLIWAVATPQYVPKHPNDPKEGNINRNKLREEVLEKINDQVSIEMKASLVYMTMASHFNSEKQDRPGFAKFFRKCSEEEREHAQKFIDYMNKRGASISRLNIPMPNDYEWSNGLQALQDALALENTVTDKLMDIHKSATEVNDGHLTDYLESEFLDEQIESIHQLHGYIHNLEVMMHEKKAKGNKHDMLAEYLFDLKLQGKEHTIANLI